MHLYKLYLATGGVHYRIRDDGCVEYLHQIGSHMGWCISVLSPDDVWETMPLVALNVRFKR